MTQTPDTTESDEFYPEFVLVRRGYDPEQVEQVLDDLYSTLDQAVREAQDRAAALRDATRAREDLEAALARSQRRVAELEGRPGERGKPSFESLGVSVAQILDAATTEAAEIRRRAKEEAQALHDESEASALTSRVETDHYATDTRSRADTEAQTVVAQARAEAHRLLADARSRYEAEERAAAEADEQRIAGMTAQIEATAAELAQARERAQVEAESLVAGAREEATALVEQARRYRSAVREEIVSAHAQIVAAMTAAGLPGPERRIASGDQREPVREPEPRTSPVAPTSAEVDLAADEAGAGPSGDADAPDDREPIGTVTAKRARATSSSGRR